MRYGPVTKGVNTTTVPGTVPDGRAAVDVRGLVRIDVPVYKADVVTYGPVGTPGV